MLSLFTILRKCPRRAGLQPDEVVLTFDDGPNGEGNVTANLLNVLQQHEVRAAFCVVGEQVRRHPKIVQRIHQSGHLLVNHTERHDHPVRQNYATLLQEVETCDRAIADTLGLPEYRSEYFRAPFGIVTLAVRRVTRCLGMRPVLLSHYGWDTRVGPHNYTPVVDQLIANAKQNRGGMYVFHDGSLCRPKIVESDWSRSVENRSWVPQAVDRVICELRAAGMRFVVPGDVSVVQAVPTQRQAA